MKRLYLCGCITMNPGHSAHFAEAAEALTEAGYTITDPSKNTAATQPDFRRQGIAQMLKCDGVALIGSWERGHGTRIEVRLAWDLDIPAMPVTRWLELKS